MDKHDKHHKPRHGQKHAAQPQGKKPQPEQADISAQPRGEMDTADRASMAPHGKHARKHR